MNRKNNIKRGAKLLVGCAAMAVMLLASGGAAWGQTDYSGTYYIASDYIASKTNQYDPVTLTNNYYLCPTEGWAFYESGGTVTGTDNGQPFITTHKKALGYVAKYKWIVEKHTVEGVDYYTFKYGVDYNDGVSTYTRYMSYSRQLSGAGVDRLRVHLEKTETPGDNELFRIVKQGSYLVISPKNTDADESDKTKYLTVNGGNVNNYEGNPGKTGGPSPYTNTKGIVGTYWDITDVNVPFYLEDVITRPTICFNTSNQVEITRADATKIIYTTDGSTPTTTNPTATTVDGTTATFAPAADLTTVKAVAVVGGELSNVTTFTPPVLCGSAHKYLIQSQNNAWNSTDFHFYLVPGDVDNNSYIRVNTTSLFRPAMEWYFQSAGMEDGVQYYHIVNNKTEKYLCSDSDRPVYMDDAGSANKFKCSIDESATPGTYLIRKYGLTAGNRFVRKNSGNSNSTIVDLYSSATDVNSFWKFVPRSALNETFVPFTVSDPASGSYTYYKIANKGNSTYYVYHATTDAIASETDNDTNNIWYFEVAQAATDGDWLTYYHIRRAKTGEYLYYHSSSDKFRKSGTIEGDADNYQFAWAKTADATESYYIIPKPLKDASQNQFKTMRRNSGNIVTILTRGAGDAAWTFNAADYTCAAPTISWGGSGYEITSRQSDAKYYYTINGDTPTTALTPYSAAIAVADLGVASATIKAIAARKGNGDDASAVTSLTVSRVAAPGFELTDDGKVRLTCATPGAAIHYTMGATPAVPTASSTLYEGPIENAAGKYIKAIAVKDGWINSTVATTSELIEFPCSTPVIMKTSSTTFTITCGFPTSGVTIYYTTNGDTPTDASPNSVSSGATVTFNPASLPFTVKAIAYATDYETSEVATKTIVENLNEDVDGYYMIANADDYKKFVQMVNGDEYDGKYKITAGFTYPEDAEAIINTFGGELKGVPDANGLLPVVSGLTHALLPTVNGGSVHDIILDGVAITTGTNVGAICNEARGDSRIYNCGVLSGSLTGSNDVGGIVGLLDGTSHVVNCYSYATIAGGDTVAGIVGYNNGNSYWTTGESGALHVETMVMNCMFYGDITGGDYVSPVYGGNNINNLYVNDESNIGLNTFNYYAYDKLTTKAITTGKYNCALAVEGRYLNRFEFYRLLLNSNRNLAAIYASTATVTVAPEAMAKWVLETADRTIANPKPYPILKQPGRYYPSIINIDAQHAEQITLDANGQIPEEDRNKGGKLGTLSVHVSGVGSNAPTEAIIEKHDLTLNRTDKDYDRYNYNYDKVQLPYYSEVGRGNYTGNKVVTGWKITGITTLDDDPYTSANYNYSKTYASNPEYFDYPNYNFADRRSSQKDLYSVSGRVFSQGAYFDVPYGVTSITIEPYWGKAAYVADANYDVVYSTAYVKKSVDQLGTQVEGGATFNNDANQHIYTTVSDALGAISSPGTKVYDNAVVLVGNLHLNDVPSKGTTPFTMMSVDMDNDREPDYSLIYHHINRTQIAPIRYDFLPIPGTAQAQKPNGADLICNFTIFKTNGWFEATNTSLFYTSQVEYENINGIGDKANAPLILQGGVIEQFVSTQRDTVKGNTIYIHLGGNVWIHEVGIGTHSDGSYSTPHVPVSVTGGDYDGFYLTGTYNSNANVRDDNAECYISGGRFGEMAGAAQEQIGLTNSATKGNVRWQIYNADITSFFGGGVNDAKPVQGNVTTEIYNSHVTLFCGGPKFGNMATGRTVTTTAEGCVFDKYFGAGYGGNSYSRKKYYDKSGIPNDWATLEGYYTGDKGKYYDGATTGSSQNGGGSNYGFKGPGVATDFDYEFFVWSTGTVGVRFFVKFASFSLAQCNNVNSTLKGCTINENFYGAGSLGKVTGNVTSELEDCIVKGNAFGAGYSATLPDIPVRTSAFASVAQRPKFNQSSGMFEQGTFSDTVHYTWKHVGSYPSDAGAGFDGTQVKTTLDLSKTNLGSVGGHVKLTLKGNTVVGTFDNEDHLTSGGNVYGGGDESVVYHATPANASTSVILQGNTRVGGSVFGGGNNGTVSGSSSVTIKDPEP